MPHASRAQGVCCLAQPHGAAVEPRVRRRWRMLAAESHRYAPRGIENIIYRAFFVARMSIRALSYYV